jgi:hypothetical protein
MVLIDLTGKRFGRLVVLRRVENHITSGGHSVSSWLCKCNCGSEVIIRGRRLRRSETRSCGCLRADTMSGIARDYNTTHGGSYTPLYNVWRGILKRCYIPTNKDYKRYGARGIRVCRRWMDFANFRDDMGDRPNGMLIDRINNEGNYEPRNCRWATPKISSNNRRKRCYA